MSVPRQRPPADAAEIFGQVPFHDVDALHIVWHGHYYKYLEVFHDEGDCDMLACMEAFFEVGYKYLLIPDHTPAFTDDTIGNQIGWAWALGYLQALRHAAETA